MTALPDWRGKDLKGLNDLLNVTQPQIIEDIHRQYLEAGADIVETNTFNAQSISLADYGMESLAYELSKAGAECARRAVDAFTAAHPDRICFVAGAIGPTTKTSSISTDVNNSGARGCTYDELVTAYGEQVRGLLDGGADLLLVETIFDTLNAKAAFFAIQKILEERGLSPLPYNAATGQSAVGNRQSTIPVMASVTFIQAGSNRGVTGQTVEAFWNSISHVPLLSVGMNCALGPKELRPLVEELAGLAPIYVSAYPNAGLPNPLLPTGFPETPESLAPQLREWAQNGWLNIVGGCCGTTPPHIKAIAEAVRGLPPRQVPTVEPYLRLSGLDAVTVRPDSNFLNIGERTNVAGSPKFAQLIKAGDYEAALAVARQQVENGAQVIDVCMDEGMIDGVAAMTRFLNLIASEPDICKVPVMVDSSKWDVLEAGLKCLQGKGIVNSISLKEGEEKFLHQAGLVRRYGAAVVVMAFDERGQADTFERRTEVCQRAYDLLVQQVGFPPQDIIFDPNVLTVGTGWTNTRITRSISSARPNGSRKTCRWPRSAAASATFPFPFAATTPCARRCTARFCTMRSRRGSTWASSTPACWPFTRKSRRTCLNWSRTSCSTAGRTRRNASSSLPNRLNNAARPRWSRMPGARARSRNASAMRW